MATETDPDPKTSRPSSSPTARRCSSFTFALRGGLGSAARSLPLLALVSREGSGAGLVR